jgi:hypothetical protein
MLGPSTRLSSWPQVCLWGPPGLLVTQGQSLEGEITFVRLASNLPKKLTLCAHGYCPLATFTHRKIF